MQGRGTRLLPRTPFRAQVLLLFYLPFSAEASWASPGAGVSRLPLCRMVFSKLFDDHGEKEVKI
jgi:predicted NAD/FAD-binding protein